jgi:hypothetical protein
MRKIKILIGMRKSEKEGLDGVSQLIISLKRG